jgi:aromatic ring-cleaving dioxygenase
MAKNYEENEDINVEEYEESRRILLTPNNQLMIDSISNHDNYFNFNNYFEPITSSISAINNFVPSIEESDDIPFDHTEWQIIDRYTGRKRPPHQNEFLQLLLENSYYSSYICWLDKNQGSFQILLPDQVVALWEKVKSRHTNKKMTYSTFSRGLRCYYKTGLMIKTNKKYRFCFNQSKNNISS